MNKPKPAGKDGGDPPASKPVSHIAPFPHFNPLSSTLRRERVPSIKLTNESPTKIDDFPHISIMLPAKTTDNIHKAQVNSLFSASTLSNRNMMLNQNYLLLKSQKMILERTFERATELFSQGHPTNLQENIKRSISTVLNSPYSTLFDEVSKQSEVLQNILQSTTIKSGSEEQRLLSTVLSVFIAILRMKTVICTTSTSDSPTRRGRRNSSVTNIGDIKISKDGVVEEGESIKMIQEINSSSENFICRICEEVVPLDLIEQHSALCIKAHQTLFNFYKCGEQLKSLKSAIATQFLSEQWPGEQQNALAVVFPVLYLYSFISLAIDIQNTDRDAMEQLDIVHQGMSNYEIPDEVKQLLPIFTTAKQLVIKKKQCCTDLVSASIAINATTRWHRYSSISGIHTHLSDFEIIGRLSSGAFARVYLSRKKKTGDLFAVKVIKRSNMNQKNQVRAVSTERDIMRRLHSPYVVNFCMFFMNEECEKKLI
ncbi:hypothetical protein TRFO_13720 [Tritrichomonas foetus]|uniref:non-specific serine/threonine protein kinase n=1 Tax=Tritrichomonas foetus TaxID=1144522 RepID=A0A1J4KXA0_9EUKA|nr:hypothetical protein TRFO_13720 [Tritrichomonas foetus]|eukprot:OHT15881.1 hypothetical protein TRFO_13720 [Tritrichomonas foetus]